MFGFVEARTRHHKSATLLVKKQRFVSLVCPLLGISGCHWVDSWMQACIELGVVLADRPFGPLCRAAAPGGGLCKRAVTTEEISAFLNVFLLSPILQHGGNSQSKTKRFDDRLSLERARHELKKK